MPRTSKGTRRNRSHKPKELPKAFRVGFLQELDGRTELTRTLRQRRDQIVADIGGEEDLSSVKAALVERFCWLEAILQTLEHQMATGSIEQADVLGKWVQAVNALSGLAKTLGLDRRAASRPWMDAG